MDMDGRRLLMMVGGEFMDKDDDLMKWNANDEQQYCLHDQREQRPVQHR